MPAESRLIWRFFDVVAARDAPSKPHPDVKCSCCGHLFRNAQLGRDILPHAGYRCAQPLTDMVDMARRIMFHKTCRKADKGDRAARLKLMLGEAGEPSWKRRNQHEHPWLAEYASEQDEEEEEETPVPKKPRVDKRKKSDGESTPSTTTTTTAAATENGKEHELALAIAEAFNSVAIPYSTIDTAPFQKLLKLCNPSLTIPTSGELQKALPRPRAKASKGKHAVALVGDNEAVC